MKNKTGYTDNSKLVKGQNEEKNMSDIKDDGNEININDIADDVDDMEELMKLLDASESPIMDEPSNNVNEDIINKENNQLHEETLAASKKSKKKEKKKRKSLFAKKTKEKDKGTGSDSDILDTKEILDETGSAFDDLALDDSISLDDSSDLLDTLDDLDSIEDIEELKKDKRKEKKEKKAKKEKKPKKVKEKKNKKPKVPVRVEYVKISPLFMGLSLSLMILFVVGVYLSSSAFSYNGKVHEATNHYVDKEYTEAYELLAGMDLKGEDKDFYLQVENIMRVHKNINDFDSYMKLEEYTYALEALVRGVGRYDEFYDKGRELGTNEILDEELNEIDTLLKTYYGLNVDEARKINQIDSNIAYSKAINDKAEKINIP